jgi:hypothetical protein
MQTGSCSAFKLSDGPEDGPTGMALSDYREGFQPAVDERRALTPRIKG